jgi:exosortase
MTWNAKHALLWLSSIFSTLVIYWFVQFPERMLQLHTHWTTANDLDMGYFLLTLFAYFSIKKLNSVTFKPNLYLLPLVALTSCMFYISEELDLKTLFFLCLALVFPLCVAVTLGLRAAHTMLIPWAIVMMAMPFWYIAIPILQTITVKVVSGLASSLSLTVLVEGNYFTVPTGVVHVAGGCSGLKYFITSMSIALISSALSKRSLPHSIASVIIAAGFAMLGNWIRVFILLLIGYIEGVDHPLMADHDTLGWIVFAVVMIPWFFIDKYLDSPKSEKQPSELTPASSSKTSLAFSACFIILIGAQFLIQPPKVSSDEQLSIQLPDRINESSALPPSAKKWQHNYPPAASSDSGRYIIEGDTFDIYALSYQIDGKEEMANGTNTIFNSKQWQLISDETWLGSTDKALKIRIAQAKSGNEHRIAYYWYKHGNEFANSIFSSKVAQLRNAYNKVSSSQLIIISKRCVGYCLQDYQPTKALEETILQLHSAITPTKQTDLAELNKE